MIAGVMGDNSPGLSGGRRGRALPQQFIRKIIAIFMIMGFSFRARSCGRGRGRGRSPRGDIAALDPTVFWRIMFFYIGAIAVIGTCCVHGPSLLSAADDSERTTHHFDRPSRSARMGVGAAAAVMNAVILASILSAGNLVCTLPRTCCTRWPSGARHPRSLRAYQGRRSRLRGGGGDSDCGVASSLALVFNDAVSAGEHRRYFRHHLWLGIAVSHIRFHAACCREYRLGLPYRSPLLPGWSHHPLSSCA